MASRTVDGGVDALRDVVDVERRALLAARATAPGSYVLAALPHVVYAFGAALLESFLPAQPSERDAVLWTIAIVLFTLAWAAAAIFVAGVLSRLAESHLEGNPLDPQAAIEGVVKRFEKLAPAALVYVAAVAVGLVLLVVPGFLLAAMLLLWPLEVLREYRSPLEALARSAHVVRPRLGTVTLALAPWMVGTLLLLGGGIALSIVGWVWTGALLQSAAGGIGTLALACIGAAVYRERAPVAEAEDEAYQRAEAGPRMPDGRVRYVCPRCSREYIVPRLPPAGAICPACRREAQASGKA